MPSLQIIKGDSTGRVFSLDRPVTVIGKDPSCDVTLASEHVSREHVRIERTPNGCYIVDLKSKNGTKVGGSSWIERRRLKDGDLIKICGT